MISISKSKNVLTINRLGFIVSCSENSDISSTNPVYICLFKDYSRLDPFCKELDVNQGVEYKEIEHDNVTYTKQVEKYTFSCTITAYEDGFDWHIKIHKPYPRHYRFGIVLPCSSNAKFISTDKLVEPVSVYLTSYSELYKDQTLLEVPMITARGNWTASCFTDFKNESQFFTHDDRIRVTSITTTSETLNVSFRKHHDNIDSKQCYIQRYPDADNLLYKWKKELNHISEKYNISVIIHGKDLENSFSSSNIKSRTPNDREITRFVEVFSEEIEKYSTSLFETINTKVIYLCSDLIISQQEEDRRALGISIPGWLIYDLSEPGPYVIHHEIFHGIETALEPINKWPAGGHECSIRKNISPEVYKKEEEWKAELFSYIMADPSYINKVTASSSIVKEQVDILKDYTKHLVTSIPRTVSDHLFSEDLYMVSSKNMIKLSFGEIPFDRPPDVVFLSNREAANAIYTNRI